MKNAVIFSKYVAGHHVRLVHRPYALLPYVVMDSADGKHFNEKYATEDKRDGNDAYNEYLSEIMNNNHRIQKAQQMMA